MLLLATVAPTYLTFYSMKERVLLLETGITGEQDAKPYFRDSYEDFVISFVFSALLFFYVYNTRGKAPVLY